jgi:uncharacterized phage protein gp47/JayE
MVFVPKTFDTILNDMVAHVRANTQVTDFTVGSVTRTILEAAALEDDEQYYQMVQLLDSFSYAKASGSDLDERVADFNLVRLEAAAATGFVRFQNDSLVRDELQFNVGSGDTTSELIDSSDFPTSGYPYIVRFGEGTAQAEDVNVTNNNTTTNVLTHVGLANDHSIGARVALVSGVADIDVNANTLIQVPASGESLPIVFQTTEKTTIVGGNFESGLAAIAASESGSSGNVGADKITQFASSPPFVGALVTNPSSTGGGRNVETDAELRDRARLKLQELSRGTPLAIRASVIGLEEPVTGQRVVTAQIVENFTSGGEHKLYIDDGTGFVPTLTPFASSTKNGTQAIGASTIVMTSATSFPVSGWVIASPDESTRIELLEYSSKTATTLNLVGVTTKAHNDLDEVIFVELLDEAEEGQNYFQLGNYPIQENTLELFDNQNGSYERRTEGTDFVVNRTNGQIQYSGSGLPAGTIPVAFYTYYTGLVALAQKVLNGDPDDSTNYPGVVAAGVIVHVDTPTIRRITVTATVTRASGFDDADVKSDVQLVLERYIDGLSIGQNVILAEMIERAMGVDGVENFKILTPTTDVVIKEEELPKSFDSSGNSLVTVV